MSQRHISEQRWWKILLLIHLICYEIFFFWALFNFTMWYSPQREFIILLVWTPALLIHVGATYYYAGRSDISKLERDAYLDGFADAVRQLSHHPDRLALDDAGELVDVPEKPKRSSS